MSETPKSAVTFVGSYAPRKCGIAVFSNDLARSISEHVNQQPLSAGQDVLIAAMNDLREGYPYGREVTLEIAQHRREDYRTAAEVINDSKTSVVSLQHEYGLFGGDAGDYLFEFLSRLQKPLVSTLHTILTEPSDRQHEVLRRICQRSGRIVVMAEKAREILRNVYDVPDDRIRVVPHGVPDVPFGDTEPFKARFNISGRPTILTFGLLSPNKSIEVVLEALAKVVPDHPNLVYIVLGVTHPGVKREAGESYRISLERRAVALGIEDNVAFHNRYVSLEDLREYLQAADIYSTPYKGKEQITSGTLAYAVACGKAVVSTPYWHAQELLADGRGNLVDFGDIDGFADAFRRLLSDHEERGRIQKAAYDHGRSMTWANVAHQYADVFEEARNAFDEMRTAVVTERKSLLRMSLPEVDLRHLVALSDDTGLLQHSTYATPNRRHGYSADDVARGLVVCGMAWELSQDETVRPLLQTYLAYMYDAQIPQTGRFHNFMSFDRKWLDKDGSDDCQGRAIWALGHLIAHAPDPSTRDLAQIMFRAAVPCLDQIETFRPWAFSILGLHYYLRIHADDTPVREVLIRMAGRLNTICAEKGSPDWPWPEDVVTYDNARIPQALIVAGFVLAQQDMIDRGLNCLRWLLDRQIVDGHVSIIGNEGWYTRGGDLAPYDQQPLEAAALIGACKAAYRASGDGEWLVEMRRCFEWYLGRNDQGACMVDFKTGGCYDGLMPSGVNRNQGAESLLSWLLSLLIMHEMQTGDVPKLG